MGYFDAKGLWCIFRILQGNPNKELQRSLWLSCIDFSASPGILTLNPKPGRGKTYRDRWEVFAAVFRTQSLKVLYTQIKGSFKGSFDGSFKGSIGFRV